MSSSFERALSAKQFFCYLLVPSLQVKLQDAGFNGDWLFCFDTSAQGGSLREIAAIKRRGLKFFYLQAPPSALNELNWLASDFSECGTSLEFRYSY